MTETARLEAAVDAAARARLASLSHGHVWDYLDETARDRYRAQERHTVTAALAAADALTDLSGATEAAARAMAGSDRFDTMSRIDRHFILAAALPVAQAVLAAAHGPGEDPT